MQNNLNPGMYIAVISCMSNVFMAKYAKKQTEQAAIGDDLVKRIQRVEDGVSDLNKLMHINQQLLISQNKDMQYIKTALIKQQSLNGTPPTSDL